MHKKTKADADTEKSLTNGILAVTKVKMKRSHGVNDYFNDVGYLLT
ncbi:hypothetical protein [Sphingobacterium sp.]